MTDFVDKHAAELQRLRDAMGEFRSNLPTLVGDAVERAHVAAELDEILAQPATARVVTITMDDHGLILGLDDGTTERAHYIESIRSVITYGVPEIIVRPHYGAPASLVIGEAERVHADMTGDTLPLTLAFGSDEIELIRALPQRDLPTPHPIPEPVAAHVLAHFAPGEGYRPGSFFATLIVLMARADPRNLDRLAVAFPDYARAVRLAKDTPGGMTELRTIAGGTP